MPFPVNQLLMSVPPVFKLASCSFTSPLDPTGLLFHPLTFALQGRLWKHAFPTCSSSSSPSVRQPIETNVPYSPPPSINAVLGTKEMANGETCQSSISSKDSNLSSLTVSGFPRIVVAGDQIASKNSVLETVTGNPFSRRSGACTRSAVEIRLCRNTVPA